MTLKFLLGFGDSLFSVIKPAIENPHLGQQETVSDTFFLHSGHLISATTNQTFQTIFIIFAIKNCNYT